VLLKKWTIFAAGLFTLCATGVTVAQTAPPPATTASTARQGAIQGQSQAQTPTPGQGPAQASEAPPEKETWKAPFGGSWTATFAFTTDYSYRGISQTQRQVAVQPSFTYETPTFSEKVPITAYVGAWGSNVYFPPTPTIAEVDLIAGFRLKALDDKLTADLGYIRYNYLNAPSDLFYDFNEVGLVIGYDFGVAQLQGAVRYSPNFFANSGNAWYKWGQLTVPLNFVKLNLLNEPVTFKVFGTVGNQYVERFTNYGIGYNNYWDWQVGLGVNVYGVDLSIAYVDTNLDQSTCGATMNCDARAIFTISKTF
jgi:uncharacterized protein (TIGR02001 family)